MALMYRDISLSFGVRFAATLIVLPWLNPFAPGPMSALVPWLVALSSVIGMLGLRAVWWPTPSSDTSALGWAHPAAAAWLLAGALSSAIALAQYLGLSTSLSPWINTTPIGEAFGNLRQRNQFASLTNIALAALLWWSARPRPKQFEKAVRSSLMVAAVLLGIGNAVSSSRTGLFQSILLLAMAWFWGGLRNPAALRAAIGFVLAYALALLVLPFMVGLSPWSSGAWARLQAGDAVCSSRLTLWHNVLTLIAQQPWRGWGWGELDYAHYITLYDSPRFCDILDNAHNLPLHLAVELGVPVSLLFCGLVIAWVWRSRPWSETDPTRQMAWSVLAVIGLHSLLEYPLWYGPFQIATGLCVILLWRKPVTVLIKNRALAQAGYALVAIILGAACLYAAWDYHRISQIYLSVDARDPDYRVDTLEKIRSSFLFQDQVRFAELSVTPLTLNNAESQYQLALDLLHFSPEHRVIERVIDSALLLGHDDVAVFHLLRLKAAFPDAYAEWMAAHKPPKTLLKTAP